MSKIAFSVCTLMLCAGLAEAQERSTNYKLSGQFAEVLINAGGSNYYTVILEPVEMADGTRGYLVSWGAFGQFSYDIYGLAPFSAVKIIGTDAVEIDIDIPKLLQTYRRAAWYWDPVNGYQEFTPPSAPIRGVMRIPAERRCAETRTTGASVTQTWNGPESRTTSFHGTKVSQSCAVFTGTLIDTQISWPLAGDVTSVDGTITISNGILRVSTATQP